MKKIYTVVEYDAEKIRLKVPARILFHESVTIPRAGLVVEEHPGAVIAITPDGRRYPVPLAMGKRRELNKAAFGLQ